MKFFLINVHDGLLYNIFMIESEVAGGEKAM